MVIDSRLSYRSDNLPFPPIGAIGEVVGPLDEFNEYDILFYEHPCEGVDKTWITHKSMIVFIDKPQDTEQKGVTCANAEYH